MDYDVATKEVGVAEDELDLNMLATSLGRPVVLRHWRTPFSPNPEVSLSWETVRSSSFCSTSLRFISASVVVGRAKTHFCMIVHTLGVGFPGVIALIFSKEGSDFGIVVVSGTSTVS